MEHIKVSGASWLEISLTGTPGNDDAVTDTEIPTDSTALLIVRDRTPVSAADHRFIRLRVATTPP